jgi:hypothetical protein
MTPYISAARRCPASFSAHDVQRSTHDTRGYFGLLSSRTSPSSSYKNESNRLKQQPSQKQPHLLMHTPRNKLLHRSPSAPEPPTYLSRKDTNNKDGQTAITQWEPQSARDFMSHYNFDIDDQVSELYPNSYNHGQHSWDDPRRPRLLHRHSSPHIKPRNYVNNVADEHTLVRKMDIRLIRKYVYNLSLYY